MKEEDPVRFGAEFGPKRTENSTGVSLSTFKTLVWVSNLGGLLLVVIGLELMMVQNEFYMALFCIVAGVAIVVVGLVPAAPAICPAALEDAPVGIGGTPD